MDTPARPGETEGRREGFSRSSTRARLPEITVVQELAKQFNRIVREKKAADFDSWVDQVEKNGATELKSFVMRVQRGPEACSVMMAQVSILERQPVIIKMADEPILKYRNQADVSFPVGAPENDRPVSARSGALSAGP